MSREAQVSAPLGLRSGLDEVGDELIEDAPHERLASASGVGSAVKRCLRLAYVPPLACLVSRAGGERSDQRKLQESSFAYSPALRRPAVGLPARRVRPVPVGLIAVGNARNSACGRPRCVPFMFPGRRACRP